MDSMNDFGTALHAGASVLIQALQFNQQLALKAQELDIRQKEQDTLLKLKAESLQLEQKVFEQKKQMDAIDAQNKLSLIESRMRAADLRDVQADLDAEVKRGNLSERGRENDLKERTQAWREKAKALNPNQVGAINAAQKRMDNWVSAQPMPYDEFRGESTRTLESKRNEALRQYRQWGQTGTLMEHEAAKKKDPNGRGLPFVEDLLGQVKKLNDAIGLRRNQETDYLENRIDPAEKQILGFSIEARKVGFNDINEGLAPQAPGAPAPPAGVNGASAALPSTGTVQQAAGDARLQTLKQTVQAAAAAGKAYVKPGSKERADMVSQVADFIGHFPGDNKALDISLRDLAVTLEDPELIREAIGTLKKK